MPIESSGQMEKSDFQSHQIAATNKVVKAKNFNRLISCPTLTGLIHQRRSSCILLITGGGYNACVDGLWIDRLQNIH